MYHTEKIKLTIKPQESIKKTEFQTPGDQNHSKDNPV